MRPIETFSHRGQYSAELCFKSFYWIYYPKELVDQRQICKTIIWANGTFAVPWFYRGLLKHLASWGYIVIASWSPFTLIDQVWFNGGIRMCHKLNNSDSTFQDLIDVENLGVAGHSQGGGVSIQLARKAEIKAAVAIQPAMASCKKVKTPLLILSGSLDVLAWAFLVFYFCFLTATQKVFLLNHKRSGHLKPLGSGSVYRAPICAFFEWRLKNNPSAQLCFEDLNTNFPPTQHWKALTRN